MRFRRSYPFLSERSPSHYFCLLTAFHFPLHNPLSPAHAFATTSSHIVCFFHSIISVPFSTTPISSHFLYSFLFLIQFLFYFHFPSVRHPSGPRGPKFLYPNTNLARMRISISIRFSFQSTYQNHKN